MKTKNMRYETDTIDMKETFRLGNQNDATNATERMNELFKSMSSINSDNMLISQRIVSLEDDRILKNSLIIQLDNELDYVIEENKMLKEEASHIENIKNKTETYRNESFNYCITLKKKMKGFIDTVNTY
jgi:hypothetical protein